MLIQAGASVNVTDEEGHSALTTAINYSNAECVLLLIQSGADVNIDTLIWAAQKGHPKCVQEVMAKGVDVNCSNTDGNTPLIVAAENGHIDCLKSLIEAGANVNFSKKYGHTALFWAAANGRRQCVEALIDSGAEVNATTVLGFTPFIAAVTWGETKCVELILKAGADVNVVGYNKNPPLTAASLMNIDCVRLLLQVGLKINIMNIYNQNGIQSHIANCPSVNKDLVLMLYAAGEKITATTVERINNLGGIVQVPVPEYLKFSYLKLSLKHLCRETIRNRLVDVDPHEHLFGRVPGLGLPTSLAQYLLFDVNLNSDKTDE